MNSTGEREELKANSIFLYFLPMIMFESGYSLDKVVMQRVVDASHSQGHFFRNISTVTVFAVFGTVFTAGFVGVGIWFAGAVGVVPAIDPIYAAIFGAVLSAIDPVATLTIIRVRCKASTAAVDCCLEYEYGSNVACSHLWRKCAE